MERVHIDIILLATTHLGKNIRNRNTYVQNNRQTITEGVKSKINQNVLNNV